MAVSRSRSLLASAKAQGTSRHEQGHAQRTRGALPVTERGRDAHDSRGGSHEGSASSCVSVSSSASTSEEPIAIKEVVDAIGRSAARQPRRTGILGPRRAGTPPWRGSREVRAYGAVERVSALPRGPRTEPKDQRPKTKDRGTLCRALPKSGRLRSRRSQRSRRSPNDSTRENQCPGTESNRRHGDFQSPALPTELPGPAAAACIAQTHGESQAHRHRRRPTAGDTPCAPCSLGFDGPEFQARPRPSCATATFTRDRDQIGRAHV